MTKMASLLLLVLPLLLSPSLSSASNLVKTSCLNAGFPNLCIRTLSSYAGPANTPRELAQAAVKVSLSHADRASTYLVTLQARTRREKAALGDCVEQVGDSVDELRKSLKELRSLNSETFRWQMSNIETWVSAALTNEDTCLDVFNEIGGNVRTDVKRKITDVARVTSNALYLINRLDQSISDSHYEP